jgi:hypothetical protein
MPVQAKTLVISGCDQDELNRELSRVLSNLEAARPCRILRIETLECRATEAAGQREFSLWVRAYLREGAVDDELWVAAVTGHTRAGWTLTSEVSDWIKTNL